MKNERLALTLLGVFALTLAVYVGVFAYIQHRRTMHGPWQTVFSTDSSGVPTLSIEQTNLHISQKIVFADRPIAQTNLVQQRIFEDPNQTNAPFGEIVFQDLTFLPGTVTFNFFGHEVELLPRTLIIDKQERGWKSGDVITVTGEGKYTPRRRRLN